MSIAVALTDLENTVVQYPWGYFVTVSDQQRAHLVSVPTQYVDGVFALAAGRGTRANATARPDVTMVFPPASGTEFTLIVDGAAQVFDDHIEVTPTNAVLHRPALQA
ncbi:MAG: hypothetical protein JWN99_1931 [Ilumatobacteraceae bacterium]|nr:hypothetical protein [Ilumatobacteraceae bacterium]